MITHFAAEMVYIFSTCWVKWLVGHDHMHYEVLTKIVLLNIVILSIKLHNNDCIVITDSRDQH